MAASGGSHKAAALTMGPAAALSRCEEEWRERGFVTLRTLFEQAATETPKGDITGAAWRLAQAYNFNQDRLTKRARAGDAEARLVQAWMAEQPLDWPQPRRLSAQVAAHMTERLHADPVEYLRGSDPLYPAPSGAETIGLPMAWVQHRLALGQQRFQRFVAARRSDLAILVGNGPSLNRVNLDLLRGQDVFLSNYAIRHPVLRQRAKGIAASNIYLPRQDPAPFTLNPLFKFFPVWLGCDLPDTDTTIWLNALGGGMFFSHDSLTRISWHATVSYFWLQILFTAGYRKVLLIGMDHRYLQPDTAQEGDLIWQEGDDPNHYTPAYFAQKTWQAVNTRHMEQAYRLAQAASTFKVADTAAPLHRPAMGHDQPRLAAA